jgi:hypothetical protein
MLLRMSEAPLPKIERGVDQIDFINLPFNASNSDIILELAIISLLVQQPVKYNKSK